MTRVVLAGNYPEHTFEKLRKLLSEKDFELIPVDTAEAYEAMTDAEIIILRIFKAPRDVIEKNRNLKMILRWGAGFDSVDIEAAGERGVVVTNTPGANAPAVSELAVMLMMAVGRKLLCHTESLKSGMWSKNTFMNSSFCLNHKTVGIVGAGNIGRRTAAGVQAFGAKVQYYDPFRLTYEQEEKYGMHYVDFKTLLETSDIVSLHIPLSEETHHLIGAAELARMKDGAILINTARGGLVDDHALAGAVKAGKLSGAGLDGVENEPLKADDELLALPDIIVTPHIGGGTADISDMIIPMLVKDITDFAAGKLLEHVVNQKYLPS
ncbi:2-hydroxyacid dehydrogenase [Clostridium transplantifaecale]|uniref:2-hydroxyacid dehydrogenase n=1 Tax=Clostridium transplantifaecale TaxID=2479838 RepID=UPI000F6450DC|nr:2-hydroxyacid dehydrogenase [Clostridium transplantifaecale]